MHTNKLRYTRTYAHAGTDSMTHTHTQHTDGRTHALTTTTATRRTELAEKV